MKTFAVTGANGYLGGSLCQFLKQHDCRVISLQRAKGDMGTGEKPVFFSLKDSPNPEVFKSAEVLVHCAYDPIPVSWKEITEVNVQGSIRLFKAARAGGIKQIIYISSISAFDNCESLYGQAKLTIEKEVARFGGSIIRPGLIFGGRLGGFLAGLKSLAMRLPVIPLIGSGNQILYFSHIEDLCELIFKLSSQPNVVPSIPITAACENGTTFKKILSILARQGNKSPLLIPVPWKIIWLSLKILEWAGIRMGFRSDSVISLVHQNSHPDFNALKEINLPFRNFD
jgi:nucleoside-diphosphate-sugar epimerase